MYGHPRQLAVLYESAYRACRIKSSVLVDRKTGAVSVIRRIHGIFQSSSAGPFYVIVPVDSAHIRATIILTGEGTHRGKQLRL